MAATLEPCELLGNREKHGLTMWVCWGTNSFAGKKGIGARKSGRVFSSNEKNEMKNTVGKTYE
jgi:hypothetical protein